MRRKKNRIANKLTLTIISIACISAAVFFLGADTEPTTKEIVKTIDIQQFKEKIEN